MTQSFSHALRLLGRFWLEELGPTDLQLLRGLPELAETLPQLEPPALTNLAVEYQRLFGFNLPPYESVFLDPSAMLMAPATARLQQLYHQGDWLPPAKTRAGAPDHLGLELLALADWLAQARHDLSRRLQTEHLALWAPVFVTTLLRLDPHPFYARLAGLTLDMLLTLLPVEPAPAGVDPFPDLRPPPPKFRGSEEPWPQPQAALVEPDSLPLAVETGEFWAGWRPLLKRLLRSRDAGLYLTRTDIAHLGHALALPGALGERYQMLETLFRSAYQYDQLPALAQQLDRLFTQAETTYTALVDEYPAWAVYAAAWRARLNVTQLACTEQMGDPPL